MTFKNDTGKEIIRLKNFNKRYNDFPVFIETDIQVNFDNSIMLEKLEFELSDFEDLKKFLEKTEKELSRYFTFQNLEEQFRISFEAIDTGFLKISGFLKNRLYSSELSFSFQMPKTEISYLVVYLDEIISRYKPII